MDRKQTIIELREISKIYKNGKLEVPVLKNVNLTIEEGQFTSIMGPSGSGKSTLMNILGCLDKPTRGEYYLVNQEVSTMDDNELAYIRNKRIGFVFQSFNLLSKLSALDNVVLPMIYGGIDKAKRIERATSLLISLGLQERMHHLPSELSGGQRQRVAIARALANHPHIIMADEPTGNLDSKSSVTIMKIFEDLSQQGHTIILVTHEAEIAAYAKRHIFLRDGQIQLDTCDQIEEVHAHV